MYQKELEENTPELIIAMYNKEVPLLKIRIEEIILKIKLLYILEKIAYNSRTKEEIEEFENKNKNNIKNLEEKTFNELYNIYMYYKRVIPCKPKTNDELELFIYNHSYNDKFYSVFVSLNILRDQKNLDPSKEWDMKAIELKDALSGLISEEKMKTITVKEIIELIQI